ncbi:MAG: hypothetical protein K1X54_11725 [Flavobacteriales bacterium]|nr:hypothetical protein [Flavobacteriales bacterium]
MDIYIVGEDPVTREVLRRIVQFCVPDHEFNLKDEPARGTEIIKKLDNYIRLAQVHPVLMLTDLDEHHCAKIFVEELLHEKKVPVNFSFRVAVTEAESWLMSDRVAMARFLGVPVSEIPQTYFLNQRRRPQDNELQFSLKPSLEMMMNIATKSRKAVILENLVPVDSTSKGPEYNNTLLPFIRDRWNIEAAMKNSYSLRRTVNRIRIILENLED